MVSKWSQGSQYGGLHDRNHRRDFHLCDRSRNDRKRSLSMRFPYNSNDHCDQPEPLGAAEVKLPHRLRISQFQLRPAPPGIFFSFLWMTNSRARGHLSCQMPGGGDETVDGKCPAIHKESNAAGCETRQYSCTLKAPDLAILEFEI